MKFILFIVLIALFALVASILTGCHYRYYEHRAVVTGTGYKPVGERKPFTHKIGDTIHVITRR